MPPDPAWETFAAREPLFSVLTSPTFLRAHLTDESRAAFFASGDALVDAAMRTIELRLAPHFAPTAILEYGCGVGRLALPLARRAARRGGRVTAVDRSPVMITETRRHLDAAGVTNVFLESDDVFAASQTRFDFITCYLVLQRLPPREGLALLETLLSRLVPGGIGVFEVPYVSEASTAVRTSRWIRSRVAPVNGVINLARRAPWGDPFMPAHVYRLDDVLRTIDEAGMPASHVTFDEHADLRVATMFVEAPMTRRTASGHASRAEAPDVAALAVPADADGASPSPAASIDVRDVIAATSIEELNLAADRYFQALTDPDHQLAKPFASPQEAPPLLGDVAVVLQGLRLSPGLRVLEFGAGTGWLSHMLTELGCHATLLDVSPTALDLARELYRRVPPIGEKPSPRFLSFDGRHIDLPDGSVDRIVSFHAFHHAPNPDAVIAEFGRVLAPGGIAAFAEPGPRHSQSAQSQFEMRTYRVVENDVDVHAIWTAARRAGFANLELAVFHNQPFSVSLGQYEDLLAGGATGEAWLASTRVFLREVRNFFLTKAGAAQSDSRTVEGLACELFASPEVRVRRGEPITLSVTVSNTGLASWLASAAAPGGVTCGTHVYDAAGTLLSSDVLPMTMIEPGSEMKPGATVTVPLTMAALPPGRYSIEIDLVARDVTWFAQVGSRPARVSVEVAEG